MKKSRESVRDDWVLSNDTQKPDGKSTRYYRFRVPLGPHQKVELPVTERRALMDTYTLVNFSRQDLEWRECARGASGLGKRVVDSVPQGKSSPTSPITTL